MCDCGWVGGGVRCQRPPWVGWGGGGGEVCARGAFNAPLGAPAPAPPTPPHPTPHTRTQNRSQGIGVPILPGVMPIMTYGGFKRMTAFCKTYVPRHVADVLEAIKDSEEAVKASA